MVIGLFVITTGFVVKVTSVTCQLSYENIAMAAAMYLSFSTFSTVLICEHLPPHLTSTPASQPGQNMTKKALLFSATVLYTYTK
jgi:hypothetical protein